MSNIEAMCEHNKKEAAAVGRKDLVRVGISLILFIVHMSLVASRHLST